LHHAVRQQALTVALPVRSGQAAALDAWLDVHAADVKRRLAAVMSLHFGRFVLVPHGLSAADDDAARVRALLLVESNFDGELAAHLEELWHTAGDALDPLLAHCVGWEPRGGDAATFGRYVRAHLRETSAFFVAHPGLSVTRVQADARLRAEVGRYLDEQWDVLASLSAAEVVLRLRAVLATGDDAGLREPAALRVGEPENSTRGVLARHALALVGTLMEALVFDFLDWIRGLWHDRAAPDASPITLARIGTEEAGRLQLGLTHVARLKPGSFRRGALRLALRVTDELARAASGSGRLAGIESIHFARWVLLDDGRLVFLSNYDGSFEAYLGEFIERASRALTMIWSNTRDFPTTFAWIFGGASDEAGFKRWTRAHQLPTPLWYSAYPGLSVGEVLANARLRELLTGPSDEASARRVLGMLRD
jgi:hypothetical protein